MSARCANRPLLELCEPRLLLSSGWLNDTLLTGPGSGIMTSLVLDGQDVPHMTWYDPAAANLMAGDFAGDWNIAAADSGAGRGQYNSLGLDASDAYHVSYYDAANRDLMYSQRSGAQGWWSSARVASTGDVGKYTSLAIDKLNRPHIVYYNDTTDTLQYTYLNGSWQTPETIATVGQIDPAVVHSLASLDLDSSNLPHVSFYDARTGDLLYASRSAGGVWTTQAVQTDADAGIDNDLAIDSNDLPHIAYYVATTVGADIQGSVRYARYTGSAWVYQTVQQGQVGWALGEDVGLALDSSNRAGIAYYNPRDSQLLFARETAGPWVYSTVDQDVDQIPYLDVAFDSINLASVSYAKVNGDIHQVTVAAMADTNLKVELLLTEPLVINPGRPVEIPVRLANTGGRDVSGSINVSAYASVNEFAATLVATKDLTVSIPYGQYQDVILTGLVPELEPGTYYAIVELASVIGDQDSGDDTVIAPGMLTVVPVNDPPTADSQSGLTADENAAKVIVLAASDPETPPSELIYTIVAQPLHGSVSLAGNQATYTPDEDYNGADSFQFVAIDNGDPAGSHANPGDLSSQPGTVSLVVGARVELDADGRASFTDSDGILVSVRLTGGGSGTVMFAHDGPCDASGIVLTATTAASSLSISTRGRGSETSVGDIIVEGALRSLTAPTTDLRGDVTVQQGIKSLRLDDLLGGNTLTLNSSDGAIPAKLAATITFDQVGNAVSLTSRRLPIRSLTVRDWDSADNSLTAPSMAKFTVKAGDVGGDVTLTGNASTYVLGSASIRGHLDAGDWTLTGNAKSIKVYGDGVADVHATGLIKSLSAWRWSGGSIQADWLGNLKITGYKKTAVAGDFAGSLTLAGLHVPLGKKSFSSIKIAGQVGLGAATTWSLAGVGGSISITGQAGQWTLTDLTSLKSLKAGSLATASVEVDALLGSLQTASWAGGGLSAGSAKSVKIKGNTRAAVAGDASGLALTLTGQGVLAGKNALGSLYVRDSLSSSMLRIAGNACTVDVGRLDDSSVLLGADALTGNAGDFAGGPFRLASFRARGAMVLGVMRYFDSASLGSWQIGSLRIGNSSPAGLTGTIQYHELVSPRYTDDPADGMVMRLV